MPRRSSSPVLSCGTGKPSDTGSLPTSSATARSDSNGQRGLRSMAAGGVLRVPDAPSSAARLPPRIDLLPYAFVAPIVLLLLAISFYPTLYAVWLAMTDASLL